MVCAKYEIMISAMAQSCMTPHEIAEKAGVSITSVYRVRKGYLVKMEILGKICKVLDLNCNEVIDFERLKKYRERKVNNH